MCLPNKTNRFIESCSDNISRAKEVIKNADKVIIGIGAGMSASGGLCYTDPALAFRWYPAYYAMGKRSIIDIMSGFWPNTINEKNSQSYWGFWAKHIYHIRYEAEATAPYSKLFRMMQEKDYFIVSTNVDGQLEKVGFKKEEIFAPQGDYALFQCQKPCSQEVYGNKTMVDAMLANMVSPIEIRAEDVPRCPRCGAYLIPNLRCDFAFVENPHIANMVAYQAFAKKAYGQNLVLLELGVGFNTPVIIRYPFEKIVTQFPNTTLIRINRDYADVPEKIKLRSIVFQQDVNNALAEIASC